MTPDGKWKNGVVIVIIAAAVAAYAAIQWQQRPSAPPGAAETLHGTAVAAVPGGRVTMIDLGATECVPCKMMAPILAALKTEYAGRADIVFIDVWKDPAQAKKYGIRAIPTQIFFDAEGREVYRHTGFMDKKRIVEVLTRLGVS